MSVTLVTIFKVRWAVRQIEKPGYTLSIIIRRIITAFAFVGFCASIYFDTHYYDSYVFSSSPQPGEGVVCWSGDGRTPKWKICRPLKYQKYQKYQKLPPSLPEKYFTPESFSPTFSTLSGY